MTHFHATKSRATKSLALLGLVCALAACGSPSHGYYDNKGNYVTSPTTFGTDHNTYGPAQGDYYQSHSGYDRAGYYDRYDHYTAMGGDIKVPEVMFPPRGMCRVWFTERTPANQPEVETCDGIKSRVPNGAFVIYGG